MHERNREKFLSDFVKQHQSKGSPLAAKTPQQVLDQVITELGTRPKTPFAVYGVQDTSGQIVQVIDNMATGEVVELPPGHWDLQPAQDPQLTIVSDGVQAFYAASFFNGSKQRPTVSVGGMSPMASGGQVQTPLPAASAGGTMQMSSSGSGDAYYGMAPAGPLQASVSKLCGQTCSLCSDQRVHMAHDSSARIMSMCYSRREMQGARVHV